MTNRELCRRSDCFYWNRAFNDPMKCRYMEITGKSRIKGLPPKLQLPCNCPYYEPSGRKAAALANPDWKDEALTLYRAGATDKEIETALELRRGAACEWRHRMRLPVNRDQMGTGERYDWEAARKLYDEGACDQEIMALLGCSQTTVVRWRDREGLELHPARARKAELRRQKRREE